MSGLLDGLAATVLEAAGDLFSDARLVISTTGASDGQGGFAAGREDIYACKALVDTYSDYRHAAGIPATDRKVIVLGASLPTGIIPAVGSRMIIGARTWSVISLDRDPAAATYELQAR